MIECVASVRHLVVALAVTLAFEEASAVSGHEPRGTVPLARLTPCERALCRPDGSPFRWRGVTAFALLDLVADGKNRDARAFLQWARDTRFTVVRVLAMNPKGWFDLDPAAGRRSLPSLLRLAAEHHLYVQIVALANTVGRPMGAITEQVREVARICAASDNCLLEIANEPYHSSQAKLQSASLMRDLQAQVPESVPVAWGAASNHTSDVMAGGSYVVAHISRSGDRWARVARVRDLATLSRQVGKFVVDNEPIGAAEKPERSRRDTLPSAFYAQGALARLLELGSTFHCSDCLNAHVPGPIQKACASAFIAGATVAPDDVALSEIDDRMPDSVILRAEIAALGPRALAAVAANRGWLALIGDGSDRSVALKGRWRIDTRVTEQPGVAIWTFRHRTDLD